MLSGRLLCLESGRVEEKTHMQRRHGGTRTSGKTDGLRSFVASAYALRAMADRRSSG